MAYNGSGTFLINSTGNPTVTGTVVSSTWANALTADLGTGLSTAICKDGQTATTQRIPFIFGINSSLTTDSTSIGTGSIITAGGVGITKALWVGGLTNIAGALTANSGNILGSLIVTGSILYMGGTTSAEVSLRRSGTQLLVRTGDDSAYASLVCSVFTATTSVSTADLTCTGTVNLGGASGTWLNSVVTINGVVVGGT